ncbi:MAG TPA: PEP-CTERM sorting domain-containing protein [candidate division Zixibacteria bacterium]|nr:PEP-CTERM sorting domain-containing protein [candidate division Zixibacteria bacterium]
MTVYTKKETHPLKWLVALIIFILVMTVTFDDVYGVGVPSSAGTNVSLTQQHHPQSHVKELNGQKNVLDSRDQTYDVTNGGDGDDAVEVVPEPSTILLLLAGLGAAHVAMRKHK